MKDWLTQFRKGLAELVVLTVLRQGETYGYDILQRLADVPELALTESILYPLLARLARDRLVMIREAKSVSGPPRRYYRLTREGKERLALMEEHWSKTHLALCTLIDGEVHHERT